MPVTLGSGTVWGLPPRHTGLVSHYGQARGVGDEPTTFQSVTGCSTTELPPQIIEYVWGVFDTKLCSKHGRGRSTPYGWRQAVMKAWDEIDQSTIDQLVAGVRPRIAEVAARGGAWLKPKKG